LQIASKTPECRTQYAPTVERQRRQQVEREQDQVCEAQPSHDPVDRVRKPRDGSDQDAEEADCKRDERPRNRDPELGAGARKVGLELRHATEEPEVDSLDFDSVSSRLQRVTELVQQKREEEEQRGHDGERDVLTIGEAGVLGREDRGRERPDDEREHDQPAPVHPDPDASDPAQLKGRAHKDELYARSKRSGSGTNVVSPKSRPQDELRRHTPPRSQRQGGRTAIGTARRFTSWLQLASWPTATDTAEVA
jgi:hypothetical protein